MDKVEEHAVWGKSKPEKEKGTTENERQEVA